MTVRFLFIFAALLFFGLSPLSSQSGDFPNTDGEGVGSPGNVNLSDQPVWLLMEKGQREMDEGEYGAALYLFNKVLDRQAWTPEAEMAIGDIFLVEGEIDLAEKQYQKAYDQRESLLLPEDVYTVLYRLADLYKITARTADWEDTLKFVLLQDVSGDAGSYLEQTDTYLDKYLEQGLDKLLELYRLERLPQARAHWELAELYYRSGVFDRTALTHRLVAVIAIVSDAITEYRHSDPLYQFTDTASFLDVASRRDNIRSYFRATDLYEHLYFLGVSTYQHGKQDRARQLWEMVAEIQEAGQYQRLSERQLTSPWVDSPTL